MQPFASRVRQVGVHDDIQRELPAGPETVLRAAWERSGRSLVSALTALTGSRTEAEDAVQDAFVKALSAWAKSVPDDPDAWLRTVAVNYARSRWRRVQRGSDLLRLLHLPTATRDEIGLAADRVSLFAALQRLPHSQREVLVLFHLMDLSIGEIAEQLETPAGTIKARLSRGRTALAASLAAEETSGAAQVVVPHV